MIINELTKEDLLDTEFMDKLITEVTGTVIPRALKKQIQDKDSREKLLAEHGEKAFLLPEELKFPIIDPRSGQTSCKLLYAAKIRARQFGLNEIEEKATDMFDKCSCDTRVNIRLEEHEESYDLSELLGALEYDFSEMRDKENKE